MEDNDKKEQQKPIIDQVKEYVETYIQLTRLKAVEKGTSIIASIVADIFIVLCLSVTCIFALTTLAFYLSDVFNSFWKGFGTVTLLCLLIVIIIAIARKALERPIINVLLNRIFK